MLNIESLVTKNSSSISKALKKIEENKYGCIFVVNELNSIVGVATDGDIRRFLIADGKIEESISLCMNKNFVKADESASREYILKLLDHRVEIVPIVNSKGELVDIVSKKQFPLEKENKVVVRSRSPVRISFGGGGTDLTHYFVKNGYGVVLNSTIKMYSHCSLSKRFDGFSSINSEDLGVRVEFSSFEELERYKDFSLISSVLKLIKPEFNFDINVYSDFPIGSGLGGSAVVLSSIIGCFNELREDSWDKHEIAELAFQAERLYLNMSGGWQDQYATVFGGFNFMEFKESENIVHPLKISNLTKLELEESLLLCNTNLSHSSGGIHDDQKEKFLSDEKIQQLVHQNRDLTYEMKSLLLRGRLDKLGKSLDEAWKLKRSYSTKISTPELDEIYNCAMGNGALGGKLLGAGGGGYFLFYVAPSERRKVETALMKKGLETSPVFFDEEGLQTWKIRKI